MSVEQSGWNNVSKSTTCLGKYEPASQVLLTRSVFRGPLSHGPFGKNFFVAIGKNRKTWFAPPLCVSTSGHRKFSPIYEILNTPLLLTLYQSSSCIMTFCSIQHIIIIIIIITYIYVPSIWNSSILFLCFYFNSVHTQGHSSPQQFLFSWLRLPHFHSYAMHKYNVTSLPILPMAYLVAQVVPLPMAQLAPQGIRINVLVHTHTAETANMAARFCVSFMQQDCCIEPSYKVGAHNVQIRIYLKI